MFWTTSPPWDFDTHTGSKRTVFICTIEPTENLLYQPVWVVKSIVVLPFLYCYVAGSHPWYFWVVPVQNCANMPTCQLVCWRNCTSVSQNSFLKQFLTVRVFETRGQWKNNVNKVFAWPIALVKESISGSAPPLNTELFKSADTAIHRQCTVPYS